MRIIFIGSVSFSAKVFERLLELKAEIVGVCTLQESSFNSDHFDLSEMAFAHEIPVIYADDINSHEVVSWIRSRKPDIIFVLAGPNF